MGRYDKNKNQRKTDKKRRNPDDENQVPTAKKEETLAPVELPEGAVEVHWIPASAGSVIQMLGGAYGTQYLQLQRDGQIVELSAFDQDSEVKFFFHFGAFLFVWDYFESFGIRLFS